MKSIQTIDNELTSLFNGFVEIAQSLQFTNICELDDEATVALQTYPGIYLIEMKVRAEDQGLADWKTWFQAEWVRPEYEKKFVPNPRRKRMNAHTVLIDWMPLYVGKSKNIAVRVWQHLHLELDKPTTAMKLRSRVNLVSERFRLSTIRVDVENYDLIVPKIESALRDKHHPILGRQ